MEDEYRPGRDVVFVAAVCLLVVSLAGIAILAVMI